MPDASGKPLLVFSDDWGRHPSSCQHLIRHLLPKHPVVWVNTVGTRSPGLNLATFRRGMEKIRQWARPSGAPARPLPENLTVLNPKMWPSFGSRLARRVNRSLLVAQVEPTVRRLPEPPVAITTLPITADLMGRLPVARWVYYCVDDFSKWPGLDQKTMERMERVVVERADSLIAVSEALRDRLAAMGRESVLLTHGVHTKLWSSAMGEAPEGIGHLEPPLLVFWGVIDRRLDIEFLRRLAHRLDRGTIVLAGPENDPDPALYSLPRVVRLGPVPFEQLPALGRDASVLIMPYADLPVTRAMQPLKLKEYLATGKPTVVRSLPTTRAWADCLDEADNAETFAELACRRATDGTPPEQFVARNRLADEDWVNKATLFERGLSHDLNVIEE